MTHFHRKILIYEIAESDEEEEEEEEEIQTTNDLSLIPTTEGRATRSRNKKRQIELGQERQRRMVKKHKIQFILLLWVFFSTTFGEFLAIYSYRQKISTTKKGVFFV